MAKKKEKKENKLFGTVQIKINDAGLFPIFEHLCRTSNSLINSGIYLSRQLYLKTNKFFGKHDLKALLKDSNLFEFLHSQAAQATLEKVHSSFESFRELKFDSATYKQARMPNYRTKEGLASICYPGQALTLKHITKYDKKTFQPITKKTVRVPLGVRTRKCFGEDEFFLPLPPNIEFSAIKELRILPRNNAFYAEFVYLKKKIVNQFLDYKQALGIDSGLGNWLTCVSTLGKSFIVCGKKLKHINHYYNKKIAKLKTGKDKDYWDDELSAITEKRNRQMRDARNKAAMFVVNYCLKNKIGNLVLGWNKGIKNESKMSKKENQNFVPIPTAKLKDRIEELCIEFGIKFFETEEAYTSKSSFLDKEELPKFGEKPEQVTFSGKRRKRGNFITKTKQHINADANAAANMLRKAMIQMSDLKLDLSRVSRAVLNLPKRYDIFSNMKTSYRYHYLFDLEFVSD